MVLQRYTFLDEKSTTNVSQPMVNSNEGVALDLQVTDLSGSGVNVDLECRADMTNPNEWHKVGAISLLNYKIYKTITESGLYQISLDGLMYCRVINNGPVGSVKVYGALTAE